MDLRSLLWTLIFLFKNSSSLVCFLGDRINVGGGGEVQERLSAIVMPRYLVEETDSKTVSWSMYLVWMGYLALVICRTWHLDGLKLMSHHCSRFSRMKRSFCRVIDSPSELITRYMAVSSAKSLTLDLTWSGSSFMYARKSIRQRTEPCGTPEDTAILSDLIPFKTTAWERESKKSLTQLNVLPRIP